MTPLMGGVPSASIDRIHFPTAVTVSPSMMSTRRRSPSDRALPYTSTARPNRSASGPSTTSAKYSTVERSREAAGGLEVRG